jgi:hypothetical protein
MDSPEGMKRKLAMRRAILILRACPIPTNTSPSSKKSKHASPKEVSISQTPKSKMASNTADT